jgi:type I restriction enzyme M protein
MPRKAKTETKQSPAKVTQSTLVLNSGENHLDISALEIWLWDAACAIRGATDAPKFKDFILPLVFYKRLSDVFSDELAKAATKFGGEANALKIIEQDHKRALKENRKLIVRFFIPSGYQGMVSIWPGSWIAGFTGTSRVI